MFLKKTILRYLMPIDLIGLAGLLTVIFLYFYYSTPFNYQDLLFVSGAVILLLIIAAAITFLMALFLYWRPSPPHHLADCFKLARREMKIFVRQIVPFFVFISLYNQIHDLARRINNNDLDYLLIKVDRCLLAGRDVAVLAEKLISDNLSNWLAFAYSSFFIFFLITPLFLFLIKKNRAVEDLLLSIIIASYLGLIGYVLVPCVGPVLAQQNLLTVPLWQNSGFFETLFQGAVFDYAGYKDFFHCFPSLHVAISLIFLIVIKRHSKILFIIYLPIILSIWLATLYLRWHYLIDDLAGATIGLLALALAPMINQWWRRKAAVINSNSL